LIPLANFDFARKLCHAVLTLPCDAIARKSRKLICPTSDLCGTFSCPEQSAGPPPAVPTDCRNDGPSMGFQSGISGYPVRSLPRGAVGRPGACLLNAAGPPVARDWCCF